MKLISKDIYEQIKDLSVLVTALKSHKGYSNRVSDKQQKAVNQLKIRINRHLEEVNTKIIYNYSF